MEKTLKAKSLLFILLCGLCWGPSYLFIKIAVVEIPPITLVLGRVAIASLILFVLCLIQKQKILAWTSHWKHFVILGITLNVLPFCLISFGEVYISSSLAGILNSLTLIFTAILGHFFGMRDPLNKNKILGISAGLVGLAIIYLPLVVQGKLGGALGAFLLVLACLSYGCGTVYARMHLQKIPGTVLLTAQLFIATLILIPISLFVDAPYNLPVPSLESILSVIALSLIGTVGGFLFYYKAIQLAGSTYASLSVLLIPILAIILGFLFLHEELSWNMYLGTFFILTGIITVNPISLKT